MYDAIAAGAAMASVFKLRVPNAAHTVWYEGLFDDVHGVDGLPRARVIRAGRRKHEVWNTHPKLKRNPRAITWTIEVANDDKWWHPGVGTAFRPVVSSYQAPPQECYLTHFVYVDINGTWTEMTDLAYIGEITKLEHKPTVQDDTPVPTTMLLSTEQAQAWTVLRRTFDADDGDDDLVTDGASGDLDFNY